MIFVAQIRKKQLKFNIPTKISGISKATCEQMGLHYVEANKECQDLILKTALQLGMRYLSESLQSKSQK